MKRSLTYALTTLLSMIFALTASAKITGKLIDATDKSPIMEATIKLVKANRDSTFVNGSTTDLDGNFSIPTVAAGKYVLKITYLGYNDVKKDITVPSSGKLSVGEIAMTTSSIMLKETVVVGVKPEIVAKTDTIEYNADSYKTQVNAVVEDLLKRLPGVEVSSDGTITANGKTVSKFLIDGKEFFADDPTVATKNLPASMINKLQVIDRKSDLARLTGVDDGEDETVINLTVKKGMNQGWMGNVTAGYGTDDRYGARGMLSYFRDGNQFTLIGGANNTNNMGFSDGGASRFSRGNGSGINTSQDLGVNFNVGNEEVFRVGGHVMYSHSARESQSQSAVTTAYTDYVRLTESKSLGENNRHNLSAQFRMRWQVDSFNTIEFRPNMSLNFSKSWGNSISQSATGTSAATATAINNSIEQDVDKGSSYEFGGEFTYNHNFKRHKGRSFSINLRYNYSNVHEDNNSHTVNNYVDEEEEDEDISQLIKNHTWSNTINGRITWTEPLGNVKNGNFLQFAYRANYRFNNSDKNVYDRLAAAGISETAYNSASFINSIRSDERIADALTKTFGFSVLDNEAMLYDILERNYDVDDALDVFNQTQSSQFRNEFFTQTFQLGYKKVTQAYNLDVGIQVMGSTQQSRDLINPERNINTDWLWAPAPYLRFRYKFNNTRSLQVNYRARTSQPSVTQLQPVADESNPMSISVGNPDLEASISHSLDIRFNDFNQDSQLSWMLNGGLNFSQNNVSRVTISDQTTGRSASTYKNIDGNLSARVGGMISVPLRNKAFYFRNFMWFNYSRSESYNVGAVDVTTTDLTTASSILQYVTDDMLNRVNALNISISPGLSYRNDIVDLDIRPTYGYQSSRNSLTSTSDRDIHSYGGRFDGTVYVGNFVVNSDLSFTKTSGYDDGLNTEQWIWNASLEYQFLRGKNATVGVKAYDMLGQRKSISFSASGESTTQSWTNTLSRYLMVTASYRFQTFGSNGDKNGMDYGGFGPGRGPGGPGGGGPGGGPGRRF